jgi:hypothetical protein
MDLIALMKFFPEARGFSCSWVSLRAEYFFC